MELNVITILLALFVFGCGAYFVATVAPSVDAATNRRRIPLQIVRMRKEEKALAEKFGEEYQRYKAKTWF